MHPSQSSSGRTKEPVPEISSPFVVLTSATVLYLLPGKNCSVLRVDPNVNYGF